MDIINFTFCRECSDIPEQAVLLNKVSTFSAKQWQFDIIEENLLLSPWQIWIKNNKSVYVASVQSWHFWKISKGNTIWSSILLFVITEYSPPFRIFFQFFPVYSVKTIYFLDTSCLFNCFIVYKIKENWTLNVVNNLFSEW